MSLVPDDLRYTTEHEYVRGGADGTVTVGITDYAQGELGDVVFLELPKPGDAVTAHQPFGTIEAVKAVSELFSPVSGEVVEVNAALESDPGAVNREPYGAGWMVRLRPSSPKELEELLTASAYKSHIGE
ncbi:MAG TPA: glycine cleavage system protein GcvH [Gemmatimonadales bacterium]|jgi:glycine cleavage system H protein|nr:glycine cleavage system protein GcvH [Gemmatimonadales bacterium]